MMPSDDEEVKKNILMMMTTMWWRSRYTLELKLIKYNRVA